MDDRSAGAIDQDGVQRACEVLKTIARPDAAALQDGIQTLPNELLARVFQMMVDDAIWDSPGLLYSWVSITRVSRLWRNVAIGCATLWTHITPPAFSAIDMFIARSAEASLTFDIWRATDTSVLDRCLQHLHRTREICLDAPVWVIDHFLGQSYPKGASRLRSLVLCNNTWKDTPTSRTWPDWTTPLPSLSSLSIYQLPLTVVPRMALPSIRHLRLTRIVPRIPPSSLRPLLSALVSIETLILDASLGNETEDSPSSHSAIPLPHLGFIYIDSFGMPALQLIQSLSLSIACKLYLHTSVFGQEEASQLMLAGRVGHPTSRPRLETCWIRGESRRRVSKYYHCFLDVGIGVNSLDGVNDYGSSQMLIQHLLTYDLSQITALRLEFLPEQMDAFEEIMRAMQNVASLSASSVELAIALLDARASEEQAVAWRFPCLTLLRVCSQSLDNDPNSSNKIRKLLEVITERRSVPEIAHLKDIRFCVSKFSHEIVYHAVEGHPGVNAQLDIH